MELTHFSLFTGIGGIDLAAEWAGFETVGQCEWADYPTKVLEKHWPDVPKWRDIRSVTAENFYERTGLRTVDLVSGGFPCQPFSVAGQQKGEDDDRYLWPEMLRVISELNPAWVLGENVAGIINMALDQVLSDLENLNYTCEAIVVPACAANAPHRRDRTFIMANTKSTKREWPGDTRTRRDRLADSGKNVADTNGGGINKCCAKSSLESQSPENIIQQRNGWTGKNNRHSGWESEPGICRVANGISSRVDRLKCLGNAVVPQQVYPILQAIADIENRLRA